MTRLAPFVFCVALLSVVSASADMYQDGSNAKLPDARTNFGLGPENPGPNWAAPAYGTWNAVRFSVNNYPVSGETHLPTNYNFNSPSTLAAGINIPANAVNADGGAGQGVKGMALTGSTQMGGVGLYGTGGMTADGVSAWGANLVSTNCPQPGCVTKTGYKGAVVYGLEVDVNLMKTASGSDPGPIQVKGIEVVGASETQVGAGGLSSAIGVRPLGIGSPVIPWQVGLGVQDNAALQGLAIGSLGATGSVTDSQPACFVAYGGTSTANAGCIKVDSSGSFHIDSWVGFNKFDINHKTVAQVTTTSLGLLASGAAANSNSASLVLSAVNSAGAAKNDSIQGVANGVNSDLVVAADGGSVILQSSGIPALKTTSVVSANNTGMFLLVNNGSGANMVLVQLGPADGCGTGFRCLKVPN